MNVASGMQRVPMHPGGTVPPLQGPLTRPYGVAAGNFVIYVLGIVQPTELLRSVRGPSQGPIPSWGPMA